MEFGMESPNQDMMDTSLSLATNIMGNPLPDLKISNGQCLSHHKRQYTPSEWQSKKAIIRELYLDRGLSLKKVMEVLAKEPHHFCPT